MNRRHFLASTVAAAAPVLLAAPSPLRPEPKGHLVLLPNGKSALALPMTDCPPQKQWHIDRSNPPYGEMVHAPKCMPIIAALHADHIIDLDTGMVIKDRYADFTRWTEEQIGKAMTACKKCAVEVVSTKARWEELIAELKYDRHAHFYIDLDHATNAEAEHMLKQFMQDMDRKKMHDIMVSGEVFA